MSPEIINIFKISIPDYDFRGGTSSNSLDCRYTVAINACDVSFLTDEMIQHQPGSGAERGGSKKKREQRYKTLANYRDRRS